MSNKADGFPPIIGIDPAPSSNSWVCDPWNTLGMMEEGEEPIIYSMRPDILYTKLKELKEAQKSVLLCWDAPLTGKRLPENEGQFYNGDLSFRNIEKYFGKSNEAKDRCTSPPNGISVGSYCQTPHWTISQYCLGLPEVGGAMTPSEERWKLLASEVEKHKITGPAVVEVHPAVAAWWWVKDIRDANTHNFKYKVAEEPQVPRTEYDYDASLFWNDIVGVLKDDLPYNIRVMGDSITPGQDDKFDAAISCLLGYLWLRNTSEVKAGPAKVSMVGDRCSGAWLMPFSEEDLAVWNAYRQGCEPPI